ncbi:hypothetical protein CANCADRAFT_4556 [Tortispora caseinolytica NRRL Y-17796]|uniref:Ribosome-assembly protein 3 C-terminal domain-containing protein n=1 Tax=Tortispora caseinolytica NRRL Y-17796 TaxID=767744 RepID=A0A1E4T9K7_9ASCO|nr:hypothetical protein CANCADRAFT_4556 [Tortispora caseinolytica NRRL Y-17796]
MTQPERKKKRQRKSRAVQGDSSSSSDEETQVAEDVQMEDEQPEESDTEKPVESATVPRATPKQIIEDMKKLPPVLRDYDNDKASEQKFLKAVTDEFAQEILQLRESKDFDVSHIPILASTLKQGRNVFESDEL